MSDRRHEVLKIFYSILDRLQKRVGGTRTLADCDGRVSWPIRGAYLFFEAGERRADSGVGGRVVRVGTHALVSSSRTKLWNRLSQHRGVAKTGGGNHRGSVFRRHVGTAIMRREPRFSCPTWGAEDSGSRKARNGEALLEAKVSTVIRAMPFIWIAVDDPPGPASQRGYIERNAISLLSNFQKPALDFPTPDWLGNSCASEKVRNSGLWNSNHVEEQYDGAFLSRFEQLALRSQRG